MHVRVVFTLRIECSLFACAFGCHSDCMAEYRVNCLHRATFVVRCILSRMSANVFVWCGNLFVCDVLLKVFVLVL